jgi:DNA damage-inducible protein 1
MINLSVMHGNDVRAVDVDSDETIENVKAVLEVEYNIPLSKQILVFEGKIMNNGSRLCDLNVRNNDMILLELHRPAPQPQASRPASATSNAAQRGPINLGMLGSLFNPLQRYMKEAEELLQLATVDPFLRRRIAENNAPLAAALESNSVQNVAKELADIHRQRAENEAKKQAAIIRLNSNPLDVEAQREIEEAIRLENINSNLEQVFQSFRI